MPPKRTDSQEDGHKNEFSRGTVELAVLAMLDSGDMYGYDLMGTIAARTGSSLEIKEGTLYPVLHRLEGAGHVTSTWDVAERGSPRKYYGLTAQGRVRLESLKDEWQRVVAGMSLILKGVGR